MIKPTLKQLIPLFIIIIGIVIFGLLKITRPAAIPVTHTERNWQIETLIAKPQSISPSLTLYGHIESPSLVQATAPKKGWVTLLNVREGDAIKKGQLLLTLDERDFKPHLIQAEAGVAELKGLIKSEKSRYKSDKQAFSYEKSILQSEQMAVSRAKMLKEKKLGSVVALEEAEVELNRQQLAFTTRKLALNDHAARLQQLQARLNSAQAKVELAQLDLERSKIIAPFDGYVEKLFVTTGVQVQENQALFTFYSTEKLEIRAKIPSAFHSEIQQSLKSQQPLLASANYAGIPLTLKLNRLSGVADARGIDALFEISSNAQAIKPGGSISLLLKRPTKGNVVILPYSAIYDNNQIYRIDNGRLQKIKIQIAGNYVKDNDEQILITSDNIKQGDEILTTHLPNAMTGLKIKVENPQ
jgi:RND family efflux transporter MFP subunit